MKSVTVKPITHLHMHAFMNKHECGHPVVDEAIRYFYSVRAELGNLLAQQPLQAVRLANDALNSVMLGMRLAARDGIAGRDLSVWQRLRGEKRNGAFLAGFTREAEKLFFLCLFDAGHNLPELQRGYTKIDAAYEIASVLSCLYLHPRGRRLVPVHFS